MNTAVNRTFSTKTGTCTITPTQIILERNGARGSVSQLLMGNSIRRPLIIYTIIGLGFVTLGTSYMNRRQIPQAIVPLALGLFFLWNVYNARNKSGAPIIERHTVRSVTAHPPNPPTTRGYFTVTFEENGKLRERLILLPGSMSNGSEEWAKAVTVMREEGLLTNDHSPASH